MADRIGEGTETRRRGAPLWIVALAVTSALQVTSSALVGALPVIAPQLTAAAGVAPEAVGPLTSAASFGSMLFFVAGNPLLPRFGAVRLLQAGAVAAALSLLLLTTGWWPLMLLAAILVGVGYGPSPPAGSDLLQRHSPGHRRVLAFSIKQAAAPLGGVLGGLLLPPIATSLGWRTALVALMAAAIASAVAVEPWRRGLDVEREPMPLRLRAMLSPHALARPFTALGGGRRLWRVSYVGFCLAISQGVILGFFVTDLVDGLGFGLEAAGLAFAAMQAAGVVGRVTMGWTADRVGSADRVLLALAVTATAAHLVVAALGGGAPLPVVALAAFAAGFGATSWNGVYLAEVARAAPPGRIGEATSGSTFIVFAAYVLGPIVFAALVAATRSYATIFAVTAVLPLSAALVIAMAARRRDT